MIAILYGSALAACVLVELLNVELLLDPVIHAGRGACADPCFPWGRIR